MIQSSDNDVSGLSTMSIAGHIDDAAVVFNGDPVARNANQHNNNNRTALDAPVNVPVLIIGGGPTGLLQAHLLSKLGLRCLIVERYPERLGAPKAHALSPRSLEICRQFNLDVRRIRNLGTRREDAFWVQFVTSLTGETVGYLPYERMDPGVLEDTPEMIHNIPQPVFEQFLTEHLSADPNVEIRKGVSFVSLEHAGDEVLTRVEERVTGGHFQIRSRHVIACDGAKSKVRDFLKIESDGEDSYETMMTIHFNADLRPTVGKSVGMLHWIMDPAAAGFIIGYDLGGNQVLISNFDSDKHPVETWNEDLCRSVVTAAIGQKIPFDVLSYRPWILSRKVAKQYRQQNVFLAGDAAHSFPPTGGLGLNSGLADVHNLAYKIAAVHKGWAKPEILDTYQADRQHVAQINSKQSVKNGQKIFGLLKTLGTAGIDIETARKNLFMTIHDPEKMKKIAEGIEDQREHFDNLELHIGYVYGSSVIPPHASHYVPKWIAGARLPHSWITLPAKSAVTCRHQAVDVSYVAELFSEEVAQKQFTTLDLCDPDTFTFIVAKSVWWDEVIDRVNSHYKSSGLIMKNFRPEGDFKVVAGHNGDNWLEGSGLRSGGGVLVRPDQHILLPLTASTSAEEVLLALERHLGM